MEKITRMKNCKNTGIPEEFCSCGLHLEFIRNWEELSKVKSDTHYLEIDRGSGWIKPKDETSGEDHYYLSTHTFYSDSYKKESRVLQDYGFNVILDNWDKYTDVSQKTILELKKPLYFPCPNPNCGKKFEIKYLNQENEIKCSCKAEFEFRTSIMSRMTIKEPEIAKAIT